jgi:hypothetical protein
MPRQIIFVHVPKAGGNSVIKAFKNDRLKVWGHNKYLPGYLTYPESYRWKLLRVIPDMIRDKFIVSFCVVRNPWDRVLSAYIYLQAGGKGYSDEQDFKKYAAEYSDFNAFVIKGLRTASENQIHFIPQTFWFVDKRGRVVTDKVIQLENLNPELKNFMNSLGIAPTFVGHENKTQHAYYKSIYSEEAKKVVADIYAYEIELLKFDF